MSTPTFVCHTVIIFRYYERKWTEIKTQIKNVFLAFLSWY